MFQGAFASEHTMTMRVFFAAGLMLVASAALADPPMRAEAQTQLRTMEGNARRVQGALQTALRCLDEALSRADAAVRTGREQVRLALVAIDGNDLVEARRQLRLLSTQRDASRGAMTYADGCLTSGSLPLTSDQTVVRVVVDPTLPTDGALFSAQ